MVRTGPKPIPLIDRVMRRVVKQEDGCWIWTGSVEGGGYGQIHTRDGAAVNKAHKTHRVVYEHLVGPIPRGVDLHHVCHVRRCCNPAHLEQLTHRQHAVDHPRARPELCKVCGESNWYVRPTTGLRQCRTCKRNTARRSKSV